MSRFFKSAAFPILIVVVLAFFASKLISTGSSNGPTRTYSTLVTQEIPNNEIKSVLFKTKGNVLEVTRKDGKKYEIGYIDQSVPELEKQLNAAHVLHNTEAAKSSVILSLLTYVRLDLFGI